MSTFMYMLSHVEEGNGQGLTLYWARAGDEKPFEDLTVCEAGECARGRERRVEEVLPKVVERLRGKGYAILTPVPWPSDKNEITLATPPVTLRWQRDHLVAARPQKAPVTFPRVRFAPPHTARPEFVAVAPDGSWLAVGILFDPHSGYAKGYNFYAEVHTYRPP